MRKQQRSAAASRGGDLSCSAIYAPVFKPSEGWHIIDRTHSETSDAMLSLFLKISIC